MKKKTRVLIIDDDPTTIRMLESWCQDAGRDVLVAFNGVVGLEKAKDESPDLILLDLMLPDFGGTEVARRLRKDEVTKNIPVIFITVTMGVELDKGDETLDIDGILYRVFAKPLHRLKLLSEIRKAINRKINKNPPPIAGT